jgi:hypothetical protein
MTAEHGDDGRTSGGVPVTDALVSRLADEAEAGYDVAMLRRRGGRPSLGSGPGEVVPVRLDPELRAALTARAESEHSTVSDVIRRALRAWLDVAVLAAVVGVAVTSFLMTGRTGTESVLLAGWFLSRSHDFGRAQ